MNRHARAVVLEPKATSAGLASGRPDLMIAVARATGMVLSPGMTAGLLVGQALVAAPD